MCSSDLLEPVLRDAVVLALPLSPLCRDDCPGLCPDCGARLADAGPGHRHDDAVDPRWAALQGLEGDTPAGPDRGNGSNGSRGTADRRERKQEG